MHADQIISSWLSGSESANGFDNPAGPLYSEGKAATESAMASPEMALMTNCSACTASRPGYCC